MEAKKLRLIPGNRRHGERNDQFGSNYRVLFKDNFYPVDLINVSHGEVIFQCEHILKTDEPIKLYKEDDHALRGEENWIFSYLREDQGQYIYSLKQESIQKHLRLVQEYDPQLFFNPSTFRFFYEEETTDAEELGLLFSRLKECAQYIKVFVQTQNSRLEFNFDFESNLKDLSTLELSGENFEGLTPGQEYKFQFNFLSVSYSFIGYIQEVDSDFNLLAIDFPQSILATTARIYLRHPCEEKVKLVIENEIFEADLKNISICGCLIKPPQQLELAKGAEFVLQYKEIVVKAKVLESKEGVLRALFDEKKKNLLDVRRIIIDVSSDTLVVREPSNYDQFIELYKKVGYAPKDESEWPEWERLSKEAWAVQDEAIPGNHVGDYSASDDNILNASVGIIPYSKNSQHCHTVAMLKNKRSILRFAYLSKFLMENLQLLDTPIYSGSFCYKSKFTARIMNSFKYSPISHEQLKIDNLKVTILENKTIDREYTYEEFRENDIVQSLLYHQMNQKIKEFYTNLNNDSVFFPNKTKLNNYKLLYNGHTFLITQRSSIEYFTGSNDLFNNAWCFGDFTQLEHEEIQNVCNIISRETGKRTIRLTDIYNKSTTELLENSELTSSPHFWICNPVSNLPPVISSIDKTIYSVVAKYGEEEIKDYFK